jgi:hypothetical protein
MAQSMPVLQKTFLAATDLSALQWTFVKMSADQTVTGCAAGNQAIGVLTNMPKAAGQGAVVRLLGTTKLKVDGTVGGGISAGSPLKAGTAGVGVVSASNKDTVCAIALAGSSAAGDIIEAFLVTYIVAS